MELYSSNKAHQVHIQVHEVRGVHVHQDLVHEVRVQEVAEGVQVVEARQEDFNKKKNLLRFFFT